MYDCKTNVNCSANRSQIHFLLVRGKNLVFVPSSGSNYRSLLLLFFLADAIVESLLRKGRLISRGKRAALDYRGEGSGTIALAKTRDSITSKTWSRKGPSSWSQINSSFAVMVPQGRGISISFFLPSSEYLTTFIEAGNRSRPYTRLN